MRNNIQKHQVRRVLTGLVATVAVFGLVSCSNDSNGGESDALGDLEVSETRCADLYSEGEVVDWEALPDTCVGDDGSATLLGSAAYDCGDGSKLRWNDYGYSLEGEPFISFDADAENQAPPQEVIDACLNDEEASDAASDDDGGGESAGSREDPLPPGSTATIAGWDVVVTGFRPDDTARLVGGNQFNNSPPPGTVYATVDVSATYNGDQDSSTLFDITFDLVGSDGNVYDTLNSYCPVSGPADYTSLNVSEEAFVGGTVSGSLCYELPTEVATGSPVLRVTESLSFDDDVTAWLGLT
jgi:hypothetical protein